MNIPDLRQISHNWVLGISVNIPDLRQISHNWVLGISVNIPTKAFCPPVCILFLSSESGFYTFGRID